MERSRSLLDEVLECEDEGAIRAILQCVWCLRDRAVQLFYKWDGANTVGAPMTTSELFERSGMAA